MNDEDLKVSRFLDWLNSNGAKFPKLDWPSNNTISGIRGAVATEDIGTNEAMFEIPRHLMMSPPIIFADPIVGEKFNSLIDLLHGDLLLTVFIVYELTKGENSFYYPFLCMLPQPNNISEWDEKHLQELQVRDSPVLQHHSRVIQSVRMTNCVEDLWGDYKWLRYERGLKMWAF